MTPASRWRCSRDGLLRKAEPRTIARPCHAAPTNTSPGWPRITFIEFGTATSRTIASLILSGQTVRYPRIQWIFSHGGGTVPYLIERFLGGTQAEIVPGIVTRGQPSTQGIKQPPGTFLAELRKMHFDSAQIANPVALRTLKTVVGTSQILFGTDVWYCTEKESAQAVVASSVFQSR